ncbi:hypothetical protein SNEBB_004163 [Seison nebaliae]|nr:hypothetical protein SNEBB_004163 [Seison nebaliae]
MGIKHNKCLCVRIIQTNVKFVFLIELSSVMYLNNGTQIEVIEYYFLWKHNIALDTVLVSLLMSIVGGVCTYITLNLDLEDNENTKIQKHLKNLWRIGVGMISFGLISICLCYFDMRVIHMLTENFITTVILWFAIDMAKSVFNLKIGKFYVLFICPTILMVVLKRDTSLFIHNFYFFLFILQIALKTIPMMEFRLYRYIVMILFFIHETVHHLQMRPFKRLKHIPSAITHQQHFFVNFSSNPLTSDTKDLQEFHIPKTKLNYQLSTEKMISIDFDYNISIYYVYFVTMFIYILSQYLPDRRDRKSFSFDDSFLT